MKPQDHFGPLIRGMRSILGMSQGDLADALGVTRSTIHAAENGGKKWIRIDVASKTFELCAEKGVVLYESDDHYVILVNKDR